MFTAEHSGPMQVVVIGLAPGEMLLESITEACRRHDIRNGVVVSGIGTLKSCHLHHITHTHFPPDNRFFRIDKPLELTSVSGIVADGEPHLHAVVSYADEQTWSGHLEDGSEVLYLAEIAIVKFNDLSLARHADAQRKIKLLGAR